MVLCHVKCKSRPTSGRRAAYHRGDMEQVHAPLADEALDALVMVLDEIRLGRSRSRSELVARTGLGRAIVAQRVGELIDRGLVTEGEVGPSTGGRPPRQLTFRADAGHVLVADLGATSIDVAMTGLDGRILGHHDEPAQIEAGPERCLDRVDALFESLLTDRPAHPRAPVGDRHRRAGSGRVRLRPTHLAADHARLGRLSHPRAVRRALRGARLGRQRRQRARARRVAIRRRGRPRQRRRRQGRHGDRRRDHLRRAPPSRRPGQRRRRRPHPGRRRPGCGLPLRQRRLPRGPCRRRGDRRGRVRRPRKRAVRPGCGPPSTSAGPSPREDVARAASFGDPVAMALLQAAGRRIGSMLASVVNFFNPSLVVIGGGVANSPDQFLASIRETVYRRSLPLATRDLLIQRSSLGRLGRRHRRIVDGRRPALLARGDRPLDRGRRSLGLAGGRARARQLTWDVPAGPGA